MATVIFKPTEACNARCIYCDVVHKKPRSPATMPLRTLELFFERVNEFLAEKPLEHMEIVWHGGEPLLLGRDYFMKAIHFQRTHCAGTSDRIHHNIQSNLTLFSKEYADIFRSLGVRSLGTSYDPMPGVRGLGSKRDTNAYNRKFLDAIALAEEEGFNWGLIYVVTKLSLPRPLEIFHFLSNLSRKGAFTFNPVLLYGNDERKIGHLRITPEEYASFLGEIFPVWWRDREYFCQIDPFHTLTQTLLDDRRALMCADSGTCARSHLNVSSDGGISQCGRAADWGLLDYGSIFDKSFSRVFADPQKELLLERNTILPQTDCSGCRFWDICHGGCPLDSWSATGSFFHKSEWCLAKKSFIEKYFEPTVGAAAGATEHLQTQQPCAPVDKHSDTELLRSAEHSDTASLHDARHPDTACLQGAKQSDTVRPHGAKHSDTARPHVPDHRESVDYTWINPIGGLGDTLMISGVLKLVSEKDPSRKFNLVARTKYGPLLEGHPAIERIGHPRPGARFLSTNYWDEEDYGRPGSRAFQLLARMFGLEPPIEERLYVPGEFSVDPVLLRAIPWKRRNILFCQGSDSPRKQMPIEKWEKLAGLPAGRKIGIVQAGNRNDVYIRGTYSLLGLTSPRHLISMLDRFDAVVTGDNFIMHAAHLRGVPAVVLWGPTDHRVYGYSGHIHHQAEIKCGQPGGCIGPGAGDVYRTRCPEGVAHCMNTFDPEIIFNSIADLLKR